MLASINDHASSSHFYTFTGTSRRDLCLHTPHMPEYTGFLYPSLPGPLTCPIGMQWHGAHHSRNSKHWLSGDQQPLTASFPQSVQPFSWEADPLSVGWSCTVLRVSEEAGEHLAVRPAG